MDYVKGRNIEIGIDFSEIVHKFVKFWKVVLIISLAVSVAVSAMAFYNEKNNYLQSMKQMEEAINSDIDLISGDYSEQTKQILAVLNPVDRQAVENVIRRYQLIDKQNSYFQNSVYYNIDPEKEHRVYIVYKISEVAPSSSTDLLVSAYVNSLNDTGLYNTINNCLNTNSQANAIKQLIGTDYSRQRVASADQDTFTIYVILPNNADTEGVIRAITDHIYNQKDSLIKTIADHNITQVDKQDVVMYDTELLQAKTDWTNRIGDQLTYAKKAENELTGEQIAAYQLIKNNENDKGSETSGKEAWQIIKGIHEPRFNIKYAIAGFMLGLIGCAGLYILFVIFKRKVYSPVIAAEVLQTRCVGTIETEKKNKRKQLRGNNLLEQDAIEQATNEQITRIAKTLDTIKRNNNIDNISLIDAFNEAKTGMKNSYVERIGDMINASVAKYPNINADLLPLQSSIVVFVYDELTDINMLQVIEEECKICNLGILGFIYCR